MVTGNLQKVSIFVIIVLQFFTLTHAQDDSHENLLAFQFGLAGDIVLYDTENQETSVIDTGNLIAWTANGQSLIYHKAGYYYRYDVESENAKLIYETPNKASGYIRVDGGMYMDAGFITETEIIINQATNDSGDDCQLVVIDAYEETIRPLSDTIRACIINLYTNENGYLLFAVPALFELELPSFQLTEIENVPRMAQYRLSPDRSKILYQPANYPLALGIFDIADGTNFTFEVGFEDHVTNPYFIWSDDGERIAYIESASQVAIFSLESGELQQIELEIAVSHGLGSLRDNELTYSWYCCTRLHTETININTGDRIEMDMYDAISGGGRQYPSPDNCYTFIRPPEMFSWFVREIGEESGIELFYGDGVNSSIHWRPIPDLTEDDLCQ